MGQLIGHSTAPSTVETSNQAIPHAIAMVRGAEGKSPREAVEFILQLLKYNDNSGNHYSDVFWLAVLIQSVGDLEFGQQLGYELNDEQLSNLFWRFKSVAEQKKRVTDADLIALVSDEVFQPEAVWKLLDMQITCGTLGLSTSTVKLVDADGKEHVACSIGTGPVDAAYKAVDLIVKEPATLLEYSMNAVTEGIDAIATTRVLIRGDNNYSSTNAVTGESVQRTFRSVLVAQVNPLEMIKSGGLVGWLRRKWTRCLTGDVEAGPKVADCTGKETPKDGDQSRVEAPPA